ncbi:M23 family metallopeptidase [uncultured Eudoraea sp.]|uniref:M23 family metallopeptidase n=1 Tax=uncultured Eudoraea sp. TaxID=1035614 RepID=UPI00260EA4E2|nr:M23 family metallopeptidase [uncultured Eudoraea sp.]
MEKIVFAFIHLGLPLLLLTDFFLRKPKSTIGLITRTILYTAILFFLYLWGQWSLVGSYYFRYLLLLLILCIVGSAFVRFKSGNLGKPRSIFKKISIGVTAALAILLIMMVFNALQGRFYAEQAIELTFPLKGGTYYVSSAGSHKLINNHIRDFPTAQHYAIDINKLGPYGGASKKLMSSRNTDHHIFADTVYCPCDGVILDTKSTVKDNEGSSMNVSAEDGTGNYVELKCDGAYIFIPHFKQYSIFVSKDSYVKQGSPLGLVGISGFSQEPHLHFQAAVYDKDSVMVGIPIKFKGKTLSRNDLYCN